jgi:hypothetical protein
MAHKTTHGDGATFQGLDGSRLVFAVPSSSGQPHRLSCRPDGSDANCSCKGFTFHRKCGAAAKAPVLAATVAKPVA